MDALDALPINAITNQIALSFFFMNMRKKEKDLKRLTQAGWKLAETL